MKTPKFEELFEWKDHWVPIDWAAHAFDTNVDAIYVSAHSSKSKKYWYRKNFINMGFLVALKDYQIKLRNAAHEYYWYLVDTCGINQSELARAFAKVAGLKLGSAMQFVARDMWSPHTEKMQTTISSVNTLRFVAFAEALIKTIELKRMKGEL